VDFAAAVKEVTFSHVFASHTVRARQMVEPVAKASGLTIVQLPQPGSQFDGTPVVDATPSAVAARPLATASRAATRPVGG
jgi:hypothetical protein